ncbi:MAG: ABC transporter permease, partial [Polaromonas sp.]
MTATASLLVTPLAPDDTATPALAVQLRRVERRKRLRAIALTLPLLIFLAVTFLVPLGALLVRAVEN